MHLRSLLAISLVLTLSMSLVTTLLQNSVQRILAQNTHNNNKISFSTFSNATLGVNILYPSYWQKSERNNTVSFTSPLKTVGVVFVTMPMTNMSLEEFTTRRILNLRESLVNFNINRTRTEEFLNNSAQMLMFTYGNNNHVSKVLQAWTIKDRKAYFATYFADAVLFDTFLPTALKTINSISINPISNSSQTTPSQAYVTIANKTYPVKYNIIGNGNKVTNVTADSGQAVLNVNITSGSNGVLTIELPRTLIDSKLSDKITDNSFLVFLDGNQDMGVHETRNNQSRELIINFEKGNQQIKIQGSQMIPEFATIAPVMFASATALAIFTFHVKYKTVGLKPHRP